MFYGSFRDVLNVDDNEGERLFEGWHFQDSQNTED